MKTLLTLITIYSISLSFALATPLVVKKSEDSSITKDGDQMHFIYYKEGDQDLLTTAKVSYTNGKTAISEFFYYKEQAIFLYHRFKTSTSYDFNSSTLPDVKVNVSDEDADGIIDLVIIADTENQPRIFKRDIEGNMQPISATIIDQSGIKQFDPKMFNAP